MGDVTLMDVGVGAIVPYREIAPFFILVEVEDRGKPSRQGLVLNLSSLPFVPIARIDIRGDVDDVWHPPNVASFDGAKHGIAIQDIQEVVQANMDGCSCEVIEEGRWVSIVPIEPEGPIGKWGSPEIRSLLSLVGLVHSSRLAAPGWAYQQIDFKFRRSLWLRQSSQLVVELGIFAYH